MRYNEELSSSESVLYEQISWLVSGEKKNIGKCNAIKEKHGGVKCQCSDEEPENSIYVVLTSRV